MNNKIKQIIRRTHDNLPRTIRVWLLYLYKRYNSKIILDKELINNLVEYSNRNYDWFHLTSEEVVWMGKLGNRLNSNLWDILNPTTKEEINNFYRVVPYYIYSLSYWHMKREQRKFREQVVNYSFGDVLDYGGGPGDLSINLAKKGLKVIYADISGTTKDFAEWLFKKREYNIEAFDIAIDETKIWNKEYNTIICIDVIEHIPHPEIILEKMANCLKVNGRLIITQLDSIGPVEDAPMHLEVNLHQCEKLLNSLGVFRSETHTWLWEKRVVP